RPLLRRYFPTMEDFERVDAVVGDLVDGAVLYQATRLAGAPEPVMTRPHEDDAPAQSAEVVPAAAAPDAAQCRRLLERAARVSARGNVARAAILRTSAAAVAPA